MTLPDIRVNGEKITGRDALFVGGGLVTFGGLLTAGLPWAMIGIGLSMMAITRLRWESSTVSDSEQSGVPQP